jgi:hypothetical protein
VGKVFSTTPPTHPQDHVFKIHYFPEEDPIEDMPRGTSVSIFGMMDAGAALNGCHAEVWQYCIAAGAYELKLPNGSHPIVPKEHVQPNVEDSASAQSVVEVAIGQQEVRHGFHLGVSVGSLCRVIDGAAVRAMPDDGSLCDVAQVEFYDPDLAQYGVRWEEAPQWSCSRCTLLNNAHSSRCVACSATAPAGAHGKFRIAVDRIEPLVCNIEQVKNTMQMHWKELRRLQNLKECGDEAATARDTSKLGRLPSLAGVQQYYVAIEKEEWKLDTVCDLFELIPSGSHTIAICNTRRKVDFLAEELAKREFSVSTIHAEQDLPERNSILREFRAGRCPHLIVADTLHVKYQQTLSLAELLPSLQVPMVINYDLPSNPEAYLYRTGRAVSLPLDRNARRTALNFVTNADVRTMKDIEKYYRIQIEEMPMDIDFDNDFDAFDVFELERLHLVSTDPRR